MMEHAIHNSMTNDASRLDRIRNLLAFQFGVDIGTIDAQTDLIDRLYADSLDLMEMTHLLNRAFEIEIGPEQLAGMRTVGDVECAVAVLEGLSL